MLKIENPNFLYGNKNLLWLLLAACFFLPYPIVHAQTCPTATTGNISTFPNTYYPGSSSPSAGATSITLGAVPSTSYGTTAIASGDIILIIQMQGAQINSANTNSYGDGVSGSYGNGYTSTSLLAGKMEYALATNAVATTGGTLNLSTGLFNSYQSSAYSTFGQYTYQVIRVPDYSNLTLSATIAPPAWNGAVGGVLVLAVTNNLNFNGQTINVSGLGFRGGGGRSLSGGTGVYTDYLTLSTNNANASKGEGIAGMPRYINNTGSLLDNGSLLEGYPNGSCAQGAPGNAGGGGTDGNPSGNSDNTGGGGGGNGGSGGKGGNSWSSNRADGGEPGALFSQTSPALLVMGGGGGAGTTNNSTGTPGAGFASSGSAGGGIVIITATTVSGTATINANGAAGNNTVIVDGSGGGGAGGSILIYSGSSLSNITATAVGGTGGSNNPASSTATYHGPGGGGAGGVIYSNSTLNASSSVSGGANGVSVGTAGTSNYGATSGSTGVLTQNINQGQLPPTTPSCNSLAITIINFSAILNGTAVDLSWQAEDELNFSNFEIQYSTDGINFLTIGDVNYINGKTGYSYSHYTPQQGTNYYRLKLVDENGRYTYSNILLVNINETSNSKLLLYPNPALDFATLQFNAENKQQVTIDVFDNAGRKVINKNFNAEKGQNYFSIPDIQYLSRSIYMIKVTTASKIYVEKLVVRK